MKYIQSRFSGGISAGSRSGYTGAYQDAIGIDIRTDPDNVSGLRKMAKESSTTVVDLVKWMVEYLGFVFAIGDGGHLYRRSTSAVWSDQRTVSGSTGQGLGIFNTLNADALWYAGSTKLGRATTLTGTMVFDDDYIVTTGKDKDQDLQPASYAGTYSLTNSIVESATTEKQFVPTKVMLASIAIPVSNVGTGNWTLTVHDTANTVVGSVTVPFSSLVASGNFNKFTFATPLEVVPGATYHIHVISSNSTGTITTGTSSDLSTAGLKTYFPPLVTDALYHPMKEFVNLLCIGNGRFLATMSDIEEYDPERLTFAKGEKVRCLEVIGGSLFVGVWRGTSIGDYGTSKIYTWDGVSATWNDVIEIDGQINAIKNSGNNFLYILHGTEGNLSVYTGAITPLRKLKSLGRNKTVEIYPGAVTVHEKIFHFGISGGTSTTVDRLAYGYGTKDKDYPVALTKDYPISTGKKGSTVQIGCLLGINASTFLQSWKDGSTYGIDNIDPSQDQQNLPIYGLKFDKPEIHQQKESSSLSIRFDPLTSEQSIEVWYKRDGLEESATDEDDVDSNGYKILGKVSGAVDPHSYYASFPFNKRWHQVELLVYLRTIGTTAPVFYTWEVVFDLVDDTQLNIKNTHE